MTRVPERLARAEIPTELLEVLETLERAGFTAYLVGGSVRDLLLGRPAKDYDVATSARAERVVQLFRRVVPTGIKHGTVTVLVRKVGVEVTTFRGEGAYADGRRPDTVTFHEDVVQDLARRDFTINAMAYNPLRQEFVDPFGGMRDLAARLLRCVGDARQRFAEDGLRCLRAVRFASVLDLQIDPATFAAIPETLQTFAKIAQERVREELSKLLVGPFAGRGASLLGSSGLLARILPELLASLAAPGAERRLEIRLEGLRSDLDLRLAGLLWELPSESALPAIERLRYSRRTQELVELWLRHRGFGTATYGDDAALRRAMAACGRSAVEPLLDLACAQARAEGREGAGQVEGLRAQVQSVLTANPPLSVGELALDGQRVMEILAQGPGPRVGQAVRYLLDRVIEDPSANAPARLEAMLRAWKADG
jgi:tRNA nucleotidyltransferase (CCA-adding enzyme)